MAAIHGAHRDSDLTAEVLKASIHRFRREHGVPGMVAGVFKDGVTLTSADGVANLNTGAPMTPETLWITGSIQKIWTTALVLSLVDDGLLDLHRPVVSYLPYFRVQEPDVTARVTTWHLLNHSTGFDSADLFWQLGEGSAAARTYVERLAGVPQLHVLGAYGSYNNAAWVIVRLIVEVAGQNGYHELLADRILRPLGLTRTCTNSDDAILYATAVGSIRDPQSGELRAVPEMYLPKVLAAGGTSLLVTAADTLTFFQMLLNDGVAADGTRVLSAEGVRAMETRSVAMGPAPIDRQDGPARAGVALGWMHRNRAGHAVLTHLGGSFGGIAQGGIVPDKNMAWIAFANLNFTTAPVVFETELLDSVLPVPHDAPHDPFEFYPADLRPFTGQYRRAGNLYTITPDESARFAIVRIERSPEDMQVNPLYMAPVTTMPAYPISPSALRFDDAAGDIIEFFDPQEDGSYRALWHWLRVARRITVPESARGSAV